MKVQCVLCDRVEQIEPNSILGKRLRNHLVSTYMCPTCAQRIKLKAEERLQGSKLKMPHASKLEEDW